MSLLSGEWWIDESGNNTFADGDVGDSNHEIVAFTTALGIDTESLSFDIYPGGLNLNTIAESYLEESDSKYDLDEFLDLDEKDQETEMKRLGVESEYLKIDPETALAYQWFSDQGANMKFVKWCDESSHCDAREYALEHMGWIRVKGDNFEVWTFDDDALDRIKSFEEWPEDDDDGYPLMDSDHEIGISEYATKWYENIPLKTLFKAKSAEGLKKYMSGIGKFHRNNPKAKRRKK